MPWTTSSDVEAYQFGAEVTRDESEHTDAAQFAAPRLLKVVTMPSDQTLTTLQLTIGMSITITVGPAAAGYGACFDGADVLRTRRG